MAVSQEAIDEHIAQWQAYLSKSVYSHRGHWPSRLFRHEPIENIILMLRSAQLLSRREAIEKNVIANDIAPPDIIGLNHDAHQYVRLYFRPKTPTQYHIEGIREPTDFFQGKHAPVLFMLVFSSRAILTSEGVQFSLGNMQGTPPIYGNDQGFALLNFNDIYHEGPFSPDDKDRIINARCSEVLHSSPLDLNHSLQAVICRSSAERQYLLHELGANFQKSDKVRVFNEAGVFNADYAFVESVDLASDGIHVKFHSPRRGSLVGDVEIKATLLDSPRPPIQWHRNKLEFWKKWQFTHAMNTGRYLIEIKIRHCLAYRAISLLEDQPF